MARLAICNTSVKELPDMLLQVCNNQAPEMQSSAMPSLYGTLQSTPPVGTPSPFFLSLIKVTPKPVPNVMAIILAKCFAYT